MKKRKKPKAKVKGNYGAYPKTVYIKGKTYSVTFEEELDLLGFMDPEDRRIVIRSGMNPRETLRTFIHECLHAIDEESGKTNLTHKQVYALEESIWEFLEDNILGNSRLYNN